MPEISELVYRKSRFMEKDKNSDDEGDDFEDLHQPLNEARWRVCNFTDLPDWLKDNSYIISGYRPQIPSFKECFKSIFRIHNETGNIWTHLIGFFVFIGITIAFYIKPFCQTCDLQINVNEKLTFLFFFIGAIGCLGFSSTFHTLNCHSEQVDKFLQKLDYIGIVLLTVGSFIPAIYYAFFCLLTVKIIYLTIISILGFGTVIVVMVDRLGTPEYRKVRAVLFVCLGGFGFVPGVHCLIINGWEGAVQNLGIDLILTEAFLYILGAFLYGMRMPERFFPGKCDLLFQSHQIFHILVFAAALVHYTAISKIAAFRMTQEGRCD